MTRRCAMALAAAAFGWSCQKAPAASERREPASSVAASPSSAPSASPAKPKAWYEGRWTGTYEAALERIELEVGGVRAWKEDDGSRASGPGTIQVSVDGDGVASGEADGPLGKLAVSGQADETGLRLTLSPREDDANAFRGTAVTERSGDALVGGLRASSGDSLTVRKASVTLRPSAP